MGLIFQLGQQASSGPNQGGAGNGGNDQKSGPHQTEPGRGMQGFWGEQVTGPCAAASKKPFGDERAALHGSPRTWRNGEGRVATGEASAWRLQLGVCPQHSNATVDTADDGAVVVDGGAGASAPGSHEAGTNMTVWNKLNAREEVVEELGGRVTRCSREDGEDADKLTGVGNASDEGDDTEKTSTDGENDAGSETGNTTSPKHGVDHETVGLKHRGDMLGRKDSEKGYHARIARSSALEIASFAEGDNAFYTEDIETYWSYYPMLLSAVTVDKDDKNFLSFRWSTSPCCSIRACLPGVKFHSSSCCSLTFIVARFLSQFEAAGSEILEFSGLVPDIVHGTEFELLPGAVDAALQSIANVSVSSELQDTLLRAGVLWYAGGCPISFDRRYLFKPSLSLSLSLRIQSWRDLYLLEEEKIGESAWELDGAKFGGEVDAEKASGKEEEYDDGRSEFADVERELLRFGLLGGRGVVLAIVLEVLTSNLLGDNRSNYGNCQTGTGNEAFGGGWN
ncbi:hypothetical protein AHAS_Ahas11G0321600 [Arachis hypogaea]